MSRDTRGTLALVILTSTCFVCYLYGLEEKAEFCWENLWMFNKRWSDLLILRLILCDSAAPRFGVRNLRIDDETTYSLRVSWQSVDFRNIRHYRLSYIGEGERQEETVR